MPASEYIQNLRAKVGSSLLMMQSAVVLLFDEHRRLLLAENAENGQWMTIGGAIDPHETPANAAVRECWEETGLLIEPVRVMGVFGGPEFCIEYSNGDLTSYIAVVFEARPIGGTLRPDGVEVSRLRYFTREEAIRLPMGPWNQTILKHVFDHAGPAYFTPATWKPTEL